MDRVRWLIIGLTLAALGVAQDSETVEDFRHYYGTYEATAERVEAVRALEGFDDPSVVAALLRILPKAEPQVVDAAVLVLSRFKTRPPVDAMLAALAKEKKEPVRLALLRALAAGGYTPLGEAVGECLEDRAWTVRRDAVLALAASGEEGTIPLLLPLCDDKEIAVRCAAIDGLAELHADEVRAPAVAHLDDDAWQVRASAIAALGTVRHRDSIAPLIARLAIEEGRLTADIAQALQNLTGRDFGTRLELWQRFWKNYGDRYQIPTDEEMATLRAKRAEREAEYKGPKGSLSYHGIETPTRRVLFVVDVSGSMRDEMVERERFEEGDYPSLARIDIVKTELAHTIESLEPYVQFNIASFATEVKPWKKRLQRANVLGKTSALDYIAKLQPIVSDENPDLSRLGLAPPSSDPGGGRTNTWAALAWALGIEAGLKRPRDDAYELEIDTIFFLSDGKPTVGLYTDPDDIVREVTKANKLRKVVLNTIALGPFEKSFMYRLATKNGGTFVDLGK